MLFYNQSNILKMKKFLLVAVIALFSFNYAHSQEGQWKLGGSLSFPVSDLGNASNFGFQFNGSYLFNIEGNLEAGPMASLQPYFGKEHVKGSWFLPIGGEARYNLNDFFVGTDLGYGIGIAPSWNDGGFFYRPKVGYHIPATQIAAIVSYSGVSGKGRNYAAINLGVEFSL